MESNKRNSSDQSDELGENSEDSPANKQRVAQDVEDSVASLSQADTIVLTHLNKQMLSQLECPVCRFTCLPPIFMCSNGHIVCEYCQSWLEECRVCCARRPTSRCVQLEKIAELLTYPCPHKSSGCTLVLGYSKMTEHILKCGYGLYCLMCLKLRWHGNVIDLKAHLETMHPEICYTIPSTGSIIMRTRPQTETVRRETEVFFYNDEIFWSQNYFCSKMKLFAIFFQIASNDVGKASRYSYSVDFKAKNLKNNCNVFHQDDVQNMNGDDWDQMIDIPATIIDSYEDGIIQYTLKISLR